jgi:hypothetical protein
MAQIILSKEDIIKMSRKEYDLKGEIDCTIIEDTQTVDLEEKPKVDKHIKDKLKNVAYLGLNLLFILSLLAILITCLMLLFRNRGLIGL